MSLTESRIRVDTVTFTDRLLEGIHLLDTIEKLILNNTIKVRYLAFMDTVRWEQIDKATLRTIGIKIYNHPEAHILLFPILQVNALCFEDFEQMAEDWDNCNQHLTWMVMCKIREVGWYIKQPERGFSLAMKISNSGSLSWQAVSSYTACQSG